jgi:hypothetical protein
VKLTTHPHLSAEIKIAWSYTPTPQYVFMAWCLVKHRGKFTFTLACLRDEFSNFFRIISEILIKLLEKFSSSLQIKINWTKTDKQNGRAHSI